MLYCAYDKLVALVVTNRKNNKCRTILCSLSSISRKAQHSFVNAFMFRALFTLRERQRQRERDRERETERERQRLRQRETDRETDTKTDRETDRETETGRQAENRQRE